MNEIKVYIWKCPTHLEMGQKRWHSEMGQKLLRYALKELTGKEEPPVQVAFQQGGKPYLTNSPYHFNISHSKDIVVCAIGTQEMGIDIQHHRKQNIEPVARRILTAKEWDGFCKAENRSQFFYERWSEKESYLKYTGEGIRSDLRKLSIVGHLKHIPVDLEYSCCLCTGSDLPYCLISIT